MNISMLKNIMLIVVGSLALVFGLLGAFLPVLPTTPFLLLSACCYLRCSEKLYCWLINHPLFGAYIYNYLTYRAITRSTKYGALFLLWVTLIVSMIASATLHLNIFLTAIGIGVTIHLFVLKTIERNEFDHLVPVCKSQKEQS